MAILLRAFVGERREAEEEKRKVLAGPSLEDVSRFVSTINRKRVGPGR